ncbi:MAG: 16S rRNA (cytidine(1402)-2'-O)-methyltransferase [Patescibacteria group bacterium]
MPLFIVSTPIGNLKDITHRAVETLGSVDYILCEDTRVTGKLLSAYDIHKKMVVFNDFNEERVINSVMGDLEKGLCIALVSDAGTPLISDPGFKLVREAASKNITIAAIPGASAVISALTVSGKPTDKFMFVGYLSKKDGKRRNQLADIKKVGEIIKTTFIIYESPFRVLKTLEAINEIFGDIDIVVCRELTKLHEEVLRQKVTVVIQHFAEHPPKGEFVIVL